VAHRRELVFILEVGLVVVNDHYLSGGASFGGLLLEE